MRSLVLAVGFLLAACGNGSAQEPMRTTVPDRWLGEWNEDIRACGKGLNDSQLSFYSDRIEFYESGGIIRGVFMNGPLEMLVVADMSGEGQTWLGSSHFRMASSGDYITMDTGTETGFTRYRCPQSETSEARRP